MSADAQLAFEQSLNECKELLAKLQTQIDEHLGADSEHIHWGHVGDANLFKEQLQSMVNHNTAYGI